MQNNIAQSGLKRMGSVLPPPFLPYDYQAPIIKKGVSRILEKKNGLIVQPTATGKSVESGFIARACILLHGMKGLYLYNENEGLEQARIKFEEILGGNQVKTASFFGYGKDDDVMEADMVFASFQTLNNHHEKWYQMFEKTHFDFIIVNEAHIGQAVTYKEVIDYFMCPKIGMTATPERMDGLDILEIFDEVIHLITLEEAIVNRWIAGLDYHIMSHGLSTQKLKKICKEVLEDGKRISIKQLNETIFIDLLDAEVLNEIYKYAFPVDAKPRQVKIFCENIKHAERIFGLIEKDGHKVERAHSDRSKKQNRDSVKHFREYKIQFLISVDKFNQDIDLQNAEMGVFLRATDSLTVFFQQLGRLLRRTKTKTKAIILDFVANAERLVFIQELMDRIQIQAEIQKIPVDRTLINISGQGFDFGFTDEIVDSLKLISAIREGFYPTWQEAGEAAMQLGIKNMREYWRLYKKDLRLPSSPDRFYHNFPGFTVFLGGVKKDYYPTWQEAGEAAVKLGIQNQAQYKRSYRNDLRLCSHPEYFYKDFPGYPAFFGRVKKDYYPTWQEAGEAAVKLGIDSWDRYYLGYKQDIRLPSSPAYLYKDFPGYPAFFGRVKKDYYPTWQEASAASIRLGITKVEEYKELWKKDKRLPANPNLMYDDFPGFEAFLGREKKNLYPTWQEASKAVIILGIKTTGQYKKLHHRDSRLPVSPSMVYKDFPGYTVFLGRSKKNYYPTWQEASKAAIALGAKTKRQYQNVYKQDPLLPSTPSTHYKDHPGETIFFQGEVKMYYPTWQESSEATLLLGITNSRDYKKKYKQDPLLASNPNTYYKDYPGDTIFFGRSKKNYYPTWQEAGEAAVKLGIQNQAQYKRSYRNDLRLCSHPESFYKDFPGWSDFVKPKL